MDFISADRSRDQEHTAGLQDYNFAVTQHNRDVTKNIKDDRDTEKRQESDITTGNIFTQVKDAGGEAAASAHAVATFQKIQNAQKAGVKAVNQLQSQISEAGEKAQSLISKPTTEVADVEIGEEVGGAGSGVFETTDKVPAKIGTSLAKEGELAGEGLGSTVAKGLGGIGAVAGMGMAIASDVNGGFAKKSLADKIGNIAEIGGAGLDLVGLGLEATGIGAPLGLVLQGIGTIAQLGSSVESQITSGTGVKPAKEAAQKEEQEAEASDKAQIQQTTSAVTGAGAGTLGVARQQQN